MDATFVCESDDGQPGIGPGKKPPTVEIRPRKAKNWERPRPMRGRIVPVILGQDRRGRAITAPVLEEIRPPGPEAFPTPEELSVREMEVLQLCRTPRVRHHIEVTLGITRRPLRRVLDVLRRRGLLTTTGIGRDVRYSTTEEALRHLPRTPEEAEEGLGFGG